MAINLFGLTPADVAARVQGLTSSATASPTSTVWATILTEVANQWARECYNVGIDVSGITEAADESLWTECRRCVAIGVVDEYLLSRSPRTADTVDRPYRAKWDDALRVLRERPTVLQPASEAPNTLINLGAQQYSVDGANRIPGLVGQIIRGGM